MNEDLESLVWIAKSGVVDIAAEFTKPDDDFTPVLFMAKEDNSYGVMGIPPEMIANETVKDLLAYAILPKVIMQSEATSFLWLSSTWSVRVDAMPEYEGWRKEHPDASLEEFPGHKEMLILVGSDGEENVFFHADIERDDVNPPLIGEWYEEEQTEMMGRIVGPMRAALAEVRGERRDGETEN